MSDQPTYGARKRIGLSERQYAAHAGISRGAIRNARRAGRLVFHPDGSIDAAASDQSRITARPPTRNARTSASSDIPADARCPMCGSVRTTLSDSGPAEPQTTRNSGEQKQAAILMVDCLRIYRCA